MNAINRQLSHNTHMSSAPGILKSRMFSVTEETRPNGAENVVLLHPVEPSVVRTCLANAVKLINLRFSVSFARDYSRHIRALRKEPMPVGPKPCHHPVLFSVLQRMMQRISGNGW